MSGATVDVQAAPVGYRVLIDAGERAGATTRAAWARVVDEDLARPHLALVRYEEAGNTVRIARKRIRASYRPREGR